MGCWIHLTSSAHPRWGSHNSSSFRLQGALQHQLHSKCKGPEWLRERPKVTQLMSSKTRARTQDHASSWLGVPSTRTPAPYTQRYSGPALCLSTNPPPPISPPDRPHRPILPNSCGSCTLGSYSNLRGPCHLTPCEVVQKGSSQTLAEKELHQLGGKLLAAVPQGQLLQDSQGASGILLGKDERQEKWPGALGLQSRRAQLEISRQGEPMIQIPTHPPWNCPPRTHLCWPQHRLQEKLPEWLVVLGG